MIDEIILGVIKYELIKVLLIVVYYQIYLFLKNNLNEEYFYRFIDIFKENNMVFFCEEVYNMYSYVINFCIGWINQG